MASSFTALPVVGLKKIINIIGELLNKAFALFAVVYFFRSKVSAQLHLV